MRKLSHQVSTLAHVIGHEQSLQTKAPDQVAYTFFGVQTGLECGS